MTAYESGDPVIGDSVDVELACEWSGGGGVLTGALASCGGVGRSGFIDDNDGKYSVHDLFDHAPAYVLRRAAAEQKRRENGTTISMLRSEAGKKGAAKRWQADGKLMANDSKVLSKNGNALTKVRPPAPAPAPAPSPINGEPRAPARDQKQKRSGRKTQLPDDWAPSDSHLQLAKDLGLSAADEAVKFREHAAATGRTMKNWSAAFNMWIRKAAEWKQGSGTGNQPGASQAWLRVVNRHLEHKGDVELTPRDKRALTAIGGSWAVKHSDAKGLPFLKKQFLESWEAIGEQNENQK